MIVIEPQVLTLTNSRSSGDEVKLDPDERDSHTCCGKHGNGLLLVAPRALDRSTPNSENWFTANAVPLIPLSPPGAIAPVIPFTPVFDEPSNSVGLTVITFAPQQGGLTV